MIAAYYSEIFNMLLYTYNLDALFQKSCSVGTFSEVINDYHVENIFVFPSFFCQR